MTVLTLPALSVALILWILPALFCPFDGRATNRRAWSALVGLGACALFMCAACCLEAGAVGVVLPKPFGLGVATVVLRLDALAAWFLLVIAAVVGPTALYLPAYMSHSKETADLRLFWSALSLLLISMVTVVLAANALAFLVAWEIMSLSSFALVATDHRETSVREAALVYLGATRVGTALLMGGLLWTHALTGSWVFANWRLVGADAIGPGLLILCGLGVKAGMWPFHLWLPVAHPAAPSPVSALMSGLMVKVAVAVMIRLFLLPGALVHPAFGYVLVTLGAISAFWGVLFALLQRDIKRLLAYSTVENVGLILLGLGGAMVARDLGLPFIARLALAAALFHVLNHAIFKALLFLGAGAIDCGTGTRDLERLGGLGKRMPVTFVGFVLGSAAICGLPPLNGFGSEWLLYQGMLGVAGDGSSPGVRFLAMMAIGWVALVGALALACFVKASGIAFLGRPRSRAAERAEEVSGGMRAAQILLAIMCALLGLSGPLVLRILNPIVGPLEPFGVSLISAWTLPIGALVLTFGVTGAAVWLWMSQAARQAPVRTYITWECGFGVLTPRMQATGTSLVQPIARMFSALFRYAVNLRIDGANRRLFPEEIVVEPQSEAVLESRVYQPLVHWVDRAGDWIVRLQAGSIHFYLLTMFATLLVLLAIGGYVR